MSRVATWSLKKRAWWFEHVAPLIKANFKEGKTLQYLSEYYGVPIGRCMELVGDCTGQLKLNFNADERTSASVA